MGFELMCVRTQGASHIDDGLPCEDFGAVRQGSFYQAFALGDGHGDSNCPRSSLGSQWVVEAALDALCSFAEAMQQPRQAVEPAAGEGEDAFSAGQSRTKKAQRQDAVAIVGGEDGAAGRGREAQLFDPVRAKELARQIAVSIVGEWTYRVSNHYAANPLTDEEWAGCSERYKPRYQAGERIEHIYGTTLIAGLVTSTYALLIQQGDGRLCVFDAQGGVSQPIPWDDRCFANVTTSMCDEDALVSMRFCIIDLRSHPLVAVMAGSDGVEDAYFSMDQMHSFYREQLVYAVQHGVPALQTKLQADLPAFSAGGSRDDVTICGVIDAAAVAPFAARYERENKLVPIRLELDKITERLPKMQGKMDHLNGRVMKAEDALDAAVATRDAIERRERELQRDDDNVRGGVLDRLLSTLTLKTLRDAMAAQQGECSERLRDARAKVAAAEAALDAARKDFEDYVALRDELVAKRDAYRAQLDELEAQRDEAPGQGVASERPADDGAPATKPCRSDAVDAPVPASEVTGPVDVGQPAATEVSAMAAKPAFNEAPEPEKPEPANAPAGECEPAEPVAPAPEPQPAPEPVKPYKFRDPYIIPIE